MTIAIQRDAGGDTIFFDAVLSYSSSYSSQLSRHPVDGAGTISDNVVTDNPSFSFRGVVSNADFNTNRPNFSGETFFNNSPVTDPVRVLKVNDNLLNVFTSSFSFGNKPTPVVIMQDRSVNFVLQIRQLLIEIHDQKAPVILTEFTNRQPTRTEFGLIITSLQFSEDSNSGDALYVSMTLQQAKTADLITTTVSKALKNPSSDMKDAAATLKDLGDQSKPEQTLLQEAINGGVAFIKGKFKETDSKQIIDAIKKARSG